VRRGDDPVQTLEELRRLSVAQNATSIRLRGRAEWWVDHGRR